MIIVRAPLRISFVGGGSDLPDFYHVTPGKVISVAIDKYVYVVINQTPLLKGVTARYSIVENVKMIKDLKNDRIRETMLDSGIESDNMEIGIFSHLPVGTGLGGSSSFTVGLVKGFSTYMGKRLDKPQIAEQACKIEIDLIKEPIGKQDQYIATFGGLNIFQFNPDDTVDIKPVLLDYKLRSDFENHILVFFSGLTRQASSILKEQKQNIPKKVGTLKSMVKLVDIFEKRLTKGNFRGLGELLHKNWLKKKKLSSNVSNETIDKLYDTGIKNGSWGGKLLGAGGGGCLLFLVPFNKKGKVRQALFEKAKEYNLSSFTEIPIKFSHSGVEIIANN